jgi:catechol 2,3-dioxygenase-like lactoylglutathione lyase family enzyme
MRIEHFAIYAEDTVALADWYCDKFGMKVVFKGKQDPPMIFVADKEGMCIEIIGRPPRTQPIDFNTVFHFAFLVDDFDQAVAELKAKGVPLEDEVVGAAPGVRLCFFDDPAGNRGQLAWRAEPLPV